MIPTHDPVLSLFVEGEPVTQGSKVRMGNGAYIERTNLPTKTHPAGRLDRWRDAVRCAGIDAYPAGPSDDFFFTDMTFFFPVPASYTARDGTLRPKAPRYPILWDRDKLERAVNDALTGVIWTNDNRCIDGLIRKRWATGDHPCGVGIVVWKI